MTKLLLSILLILPILLQAQDDAYTMFETITLSPDGDRAELQAAMKAHNTKFHSTDPYTASVWAISSGPDAGKLVWSMGPLKYSDLDSRPEGDPHDTDWDKVMAHIGSIGTIEYWKRDDKLSNVVGDPSPMLYVRFWKVNNKYGFLVDAVLKQVSDAVKAMEGENQWSLWDNEFRQGDLGRHLATITGMKNWGELDDDPKFRAAFTKVHGEDSWIPFLRTMGIAFEDSYDEVWTLIPEVGGSQ